MPKKTPELQLPGTTVRLKAWPKSVKPADQDKGDLAALKKDQLVERAEEAGVDTSGTKAEIAERLETATELEPET